MYSAPKHEWLVDSDQFDATQASTLPQQVPDRKKAKKKLKGEVEKLGDLQEMLYAEDQHSVLLVFQALDAAGKDSTIRAVMSGINPAGCQVFSFKKPSSLELDHDFLWRTAKRLPERGRIGIFNRSYYEEVLVVRVHPEYLRFQKLPELDVSPKFWDERLESIADHEKHLARNGTMILKFWLNVSRDEQKRRFLSRLDEPEKNWKFSEADLDEREHWDDYMSAFSDAIRQTSKPWAPWYAIPADNKPYMRWQVAQIIRQNLEQIDLAFPKVDSKTRETFMNARRRLEE
ncbi:MAG: PPK2 family polyphosphate kinase [Pseudomonadota bacterium]